MDVATSASAWVSITHYAQIHDVTRPTVYKWLECGLLEFYRVNGVVRIKNQPPVNPRKP